MAIHVKDLSVIDWDVYSSTISVRLFNLHVDLRL